MNRKKKKTEVKIVANDTAPYCAFCEKNQQECKKLIAGPMVYICNECIELCNDILIEEDMSIPEKERVECSVCLSQNVDKRMAKYPGIENRTCCPKCLKQFRAIVTKQVELTCKICDKTRIVKGRSEIKKNERVRDMIFSEYLGVLCTSCFKKLS